ncbi:MAG: T9SS type A sorting domain-containing protein [Chlorobi bacterium]|nr:T9SS type A sorting domain-containing protein [Chlorobiota bacterium]
MHRIALLGSVLALVCTVCSATNADTTRGTVGGTVCFRRVLPVSDSECSFRTLVHLSNPTVWYPVSVRIGSSRATLERVSDSLWVVESEEIVAADIELCGIVLAGSDSVCIVTLDSIVACKPRTDPIVQVLIISSIGPPLPYVRFARLEGPYPHPIERDEPFVVYVGLDIRSDVRIRLFDLLGRQVLEEKQQRERGVYRIVLQLPLGSSPGLYLLRMDTTSGGDYAVVVVE